MLTKEQTQQLSKLIEAHTEAAIEHSWKGIHPPEATREIELELEVAKRNLQDFIKEITS